MKAVKAVKAVNVIGCGPWAQNHIRILTQNKILNGVFDLDENLSNNIANQYGCKVLKTNELVNPEENFCLFILSSANSHYNLIKKYIPYYKNIFVEKPVVENLDQYFEIKSLQEKYKSNIVVGHLINYHPAFQRLIQIILNNEIGEVFSIKSIRHNFGRYRVVEDVVKSLSVHDLSINFNIARQLNAKLKSFSLHGLDFIKKNHFDEVRIFLEFNNNMKSIISSSWIAPNKSHILQVSGSKGIVVFDDTAKIFSEKLFIQFYQNDKINITKTYKKTIDIQSKIEPLKNQINETIKFFSGEIDYSLTPLDESYEIIKIIDSY